MCQFCLTRRPAFVSLNEYAMWPILRESGIKGLYIAPAAAAKAHLSILTEVSFSAVPH